MAMDRNSENLIASDKQSGKAVYGAEDKKIGSIERVMIDKSSGEPAYAVLSIGGFLGMGDDHYPTTTTRCPGSCSDTTRGSTAIAATLAGTG